MHVMTKQTELQFLTVSIGFFVCLFVLGDYTLKIDLTDFEKNSRFAQYEKFKVGDEKVLEILYRQCLELTLKIHN